MNIEPDDAGWRFDESVGWKLIHNGSSVIFFKETDAAISTQEHLFVGTREECEAHIGELSLTSEPPPLLEIKPEIVPATEFSTGTEFSESEEAIENSTTTQDPEE